MDWKRQICVCFGKLDYKFASHPSDRERAAKVLGTAIEQGVSYKEYCKEIKDWLGSSCGKRMLKQQKTYSKVR